MGGAVHQTEDLLSGVLIQLIVMIAAARIMNTAFRRVGQPGVIGEIVAGLMLGPSLFGHFFPAASAAVFGHSAASAVTIISQVGLTLLMFQIGADFEFGHVSEGRGRRASLLIAVASISVPFALGLGLGLLSAPTLAPGRDAVSYSLFLGVGLAITAVPILGRILREFGLNRAELGVVAIAAAAANDVAGWLILGAVAAYAEARFSGLMVLGRIGIIAVLALALRFAAPPTVRWLLARLPQREGDLAPNLIAIVFCLIFVMGITTAKLGIFTIFGGFAAGLLFHRHVDFVEAWKRQVGQVVLVFFLPVFFTYTGLRTNVLGLTTGADLMWLAIILAAAVLGKVVPVYLAGRASGFTHDEFSVLASLMNTRALMELIVLNIGFDLGLIPQTVFTMLVIMAVVTTIMTGPLLRIFLPRTGHVIPHAIEA